VLCDCFLFLNRKNANMPVIKIEIQSCKECPFFKTENQWSSDGWDSMVDWMCTKEYPKKKIQGAVEWHEESKIKVPEWCPAQNIA